MIKPDLLTKGDVIGVYSPSGSVSYNSTRLTLYEQGLAAISKLGYQIKESEHARGRFYHMAASAKEKAKDINTLFRDPGVSALIPSIGGHTASQVLPYLDIDTIRENPKPFVGFSDSALLAIYITEKTDLITFHSAVDVTFNFSRFGTDDSPMQGQGEFTAHSFWQILEEGRPSDRFFSPWKCLQPGECVGTLIGGNLKGVMALVGTSFEPNWKNKILYWEAVDPPHVIAQALVHLRNAGVFEQIKGMVVGKVSHLKETFYGQDEIMPIHDFIRYILDNPLLPVIVEADIGHDVENITIPNGCEARLSSDNQTCVMELRY